MHRQAPAGNGMKGLATAGNGMQRLEHHATACYDMLRLAAACHGIQRYTQRHATGCFAWVGMHRSGLLVGFVILKFRLQVWYEKPHCSSGYSNPVFFLGHRYRVDFAVEFTPSSQ